MVPAWLYTQAKQAIRADGTMAPVDLALYTRALMVSPAATLEPQPPAETFEWVQRPVDDYVTGKVYVDGSRIDGEHSLAGMCARHGRAFAAYDDTGSLLAAAKGRPPSWAEGIWGAELWGLLMAVTSADPWAPMRVDCVSVKQGSQKGLAWAGAPDRTLAWAWAPLAAALDDDPRRVVWMPAHCSQDSVGSRKLGNGEGLTKLDITGNALVDQLAKEAARADRLPWARRKRVRELGDIVTAVATWIGQIMQLANHFPDPRWDGAGRQPMLRDSEGIAGRQPAKAPHQQRRNSRQAQAHTLGSMQAELGHPRMEAIARRVRAKEVASHVDRGAEPDNRNSNLPSAWVVSLPLRSLQLPRAGGRQKPNSA